MFKIKYSKIVFSAVCYAFSFIYIDYFWFCSFCFLYPLYRLIFFHRLNLFYKDGLLWGCITYTIQTIAIIDFVYRYGLSGWSLVIPGFVIVMMSLLSGFWFYIMNVFAKKKSHIKIFFIYIATILFFYTIHYCVLTIFSGFLIGYPFSFPLIPLFYKSLFIKLLVGHNFEFLILTVFIVCQIFFSLRWYKVSMPIIIIFFLGELFVRNIDNKVYDNNVLCTQVSVPQKLSNEPYRRILQLCNAISAAQYLNPYSRILVLPESIFPFYDQSLHNVLFSMVSDYCHPDSYVLLGVYRTDKNKRFNSCICIYKGNVVFVYDKKILVPFFEYIPSYFGDGAFGINGVDFSHGAFDQENLCPTSLFGSYRLMICAEVFWGEIKPDSLIIAFINDKYFKYSYFHKIMRLYADYRVCSVKSTIIYSSYGVSS